MLLTVLKWTKLTLKDIFSSLDCAMCAIVIGKL